MLLGGDAVAPEPYELFLELLDPLSQILDDAGEPGRGSIPIPYHDMQPRQHRARFLDPFAQPSVVTRPRADLEVADDDAPLLELSSALEHGGRGGQPLRRLDVDAVEHLAGHIVQRDGQNLSGLVDLGEPEILHAVRRRTVLLHPSRRG